MSELQKFGTSPDLRHLKAMTTSFGIVQHAVGSEPDRNFGYSIDDCARALITCSWYSKLFNDEDLSKLEEINYSFLEQAYIGPESFHNFYSYEEKPLDERGSDDSYGRTFWAIAETMTNSSNAELRKSASQLWGRLNPAIYLSGIYLRSKSYITLGLCAANDRDNCSIWADQLVNMFKNNSSKSWQWFEPSLHYCNAIPIYALARAAELTGKKEYLEIAEKSFSWLNEVSHIGNVPAPIGQNGWYHHSGDKAIYDQQPVDAAKMALAASELYKITKKDIYLQTALSWMDWYEGNNINKLSVINPETGGIYDGLTQTGINTNQGAESTITYLLAYLSLSRLSE